jgi:hypothetical protein
LWATSLLTGIEYASSLADEYHTSETTCSDELVRAIATADLFLISRQPAPTNLYFDIGVLYTPLLQHYVLLPFAGLLW